MRLTQQQLTQASRSRSQHLITELDLKKIFPFTQQSHNRYLEQNRLDSIKDSLTNEQSKQITNHIKELIQKDNIRPKYLQPIIQLDDSISKELNTKEGKKRSKMSYHDAQNLNLHNQGQRKEMVQLAQWLDLMVDQLHCLNLSDFQDFYNRLEVIYSGGILELERQLSITGYEFGQFIKKLWETFIQQIQKIIDGLAKQNQQVEQQGLEEINRLHKFYQDAILKQSEAVQKMKEEVSSVQNALARLKKENVYLRKKEKRREKQLEDWGHLINEQQQRIIELSGSSNFKSIENASEIDLQIQQEEIFEFFKKKFEEWRRVQESNYKQFQLQDEFYDISRDIIQADSSADTSDLIKFSDYSQDTSEYFTTQSMATQTPKKAKTQEMETQVQPDSQDMCIQVNNYALKKERVARNIAEQRLIKRAKNSLQQIINEYDTFYFPELELANNDPQFLPIVNDQIQTLKTNCDDMINILNIRGDLASEDVTDVKHYLANIYSNFNVYFQLVWNIIQQQISIVIDAKIDKQELEVELRDFEKQFNDNTALFKRFHQKQKQKEIQSKFFEQSLIKVIRHAPQFLINQIKDQSVQLGVLSNVEFKEIKRRTGVVDNNQSPMKEQKDLSPQPTQTSIPKKSAQLLAIKFMGNLKQSKPQSQSELDSKDDDDAAYKSDSEGGKSDSSDFSINKLKMDLRGNKQTVSIDKILRIQNCSLKTAVYATNVLKTVIQKYNPNNLSGLYKLSTIVQLYQEFIVKIQDFQTNTPFHVHLYETIIAHYGQSQFSDLHRFKRTLKSLIFYESKSSTCRLATKFLKAEFDVQDFNVYIQLIIEVQEYPTVQYSKFATQMTRWMLKQGYQQKEIDKLLNELTYSELDVPMLQKQAAEFDLIALVFLKIYQSYKNRTSAKYKHLFAAVDSKKKGSINFQSWNFLYEAFYNMKNYSFSLKCFYTEADYQNDGEKMMSMQRFNLICDELNIFQEQDQKQLLGEQSSEMIYAKLRTTWQKEKIGMKMSFIKSNRYDKFIKGLFVEIDSFIEQNLDYSEDVPPICYIYKLLNKSSVQYFLESKISLGIPAEILLINSKIRDLEYQQLQKE